MKPCDNCTVNLEEAAYQDEVSCWKTLAEIETLKPKPVIV